MNLFKASKEKGATVSKIFIGICIIAAFIYVFIRILIHDTTVIDTKVETLDGKIYYCIEAIAKDNGMTYIRKPMNQKTKRIVIQSKTIKEIIEK